MEIQIQALDGSTVLGALGKPSGLSGVGNVVFDVKALINSQTTLDSFDHPVTITYQYSNSDISGYDASSLQLYHYHNSAWTTLNNCSLTVSTNTITCTTPNFSIFSIFGQTSSSQSSGTGGGGGGQIVDSGPTAPSAAGVRGPMSTAASTTTNVKKNTKPYQFTRQLQLGMSGEDVRQLQIFLNTHGFVIAAGGSGAPGHESRAFGSRTKAALVRFQEANAKDILKPQGKTKGTGMLGPWTMKIINALIASGK